MLAYATDQRQHLAPMSQNLLHGALAWRLVGTPANEGGPVTESPRAHVVVLDLDDELWGKWLPFGGSLGAPPARTARRLSGKPRWPDQSLDLRKQCLAFLDAEGG